MGNLVHIACRVTPHCFLLHPIPPYDDLWPPPPQPCPIGTSYTGSSYQGIRHKQHKQEKVRTTATQHNTTQHNTTHHSNNTQDRSIATIVQQKKQHTHIEKLLERHAWQHKTSQFHTSESLNTCWIISVSQWYGNDYGYNSVRLSGFCLC